MSNKDMVLYGSICFECGAPSEDNHHVVPKALGGTKTVPLCTKCHGLVHNIDMIRHKELQKKGIAKAKERGVYKDNGRIKGVVNKTNQEKPQRAKELKQQGMGVTKIAQSLSVSRTTVYAYLKDGK